MSSVDAPASTAPGEPPARRRTLLRAGVLAVASVGVVAVVLPRTTGAPWAAIGEALARPSWRQLLLLALLWLAGLAVHSRVLTAALPGLSVRRALTLNLTGSAVANVLPLGGGVAMGVNMVMVRRWGFTPRQFGLYTGLTNAWHLTMKALLPVAALGLLIANDVLLSRSFLLSALSASALLVILVLIGATAVLTRRGARFTGGVADRLISVLPGERAPTRLADRLDTARAATLELIAKAWRPMTAGVVGYTALQAVLLYGCLAVTGARLGAVAVVAVLAVERAATALPFTPGGSGVAEVAAATMVVALGGAPAEAAAGILLYRAFVFGLEIPIGGTWLLGWWVSQRSAPATGLA